MPVPYMSAMSSGPGAPEEMDCGMRRILSNPRSCRLSDTVSSLVAMSSPLATTQPTQRTNHTTCASNNNCVRICSSYEG